ncbi:hypothetical protein BST95_12620 [Halioglobus japonicus]|uniref:KR domain-containing protein n=1 Tax=Halioglobus japonicus TaxID=930805 RepID=A0AAP8MIA0_9GAMM|nr:SDR family NAD(P)-dependent oxidoreductase [Halioglobus japonicus]AQA18958.1 hypothetical protein BST95_12620 [Halioglobus japonicus]PLW88027.1 KR domain-containing protein [Halioglobus japonicus]GHD20501.1 short-chain dehydrogenase [Halioglobus japonicus]
MKNILVTGANKGIGLAVASEILRAAADTHVVLGSRDMARGHVAVASLVAQDATWADRITLLELDVCDDQSVQRARDSWMQERLDTGLYGIVNNAGLGQGTVVQTVDVNVYGVHRVCEAFAPLLGHEGRIVNVTSASGPNFVANCSADRQAFFTDKTIDWSSLQAFIQECGELEPDVVQRMGFGSDSPYGFSKACANSYTLWLATQHPQLVINACTPGFIETDLGKEFLGARTPQEAGMKPPAAGAQVIIELLFASPRGSGHYYGSDALRSPLDRYRAPGSPEFTEGN